MYEFGAYPKCSTVLTGDVFGSRRCDCGDQFRLALERIAEMGVPLR